jgi:hypothetical protein
MTVYSFVGNEKEWQLIHDVVTDALKRIPFGIETMPIVTRLKLIKKRLNDHFNFAQKKRRVKRDD